MNVIRISAAGSGKTTKICKEALDAVRSSQKKALVISYTNRGVEAIENAIRMNNRGILSSKIDVKTWYVFILNELIRPYQIEIPGIKINEIKGLNFQSNGVDIYKSKGSRERYLDCSSNIKSNYASEMAFEIMRKSKNAPLKRLYDIYSHIYIDELQDMAGYDLDVIDVLLKIGENVVCCGDHRQATFVTNKSRKNKKHTGKNIVNYCKEISLNQNIKIEKELVSHRFNSYICAFANTLFPNDNDNNMTSDMNEMKGHDGVFIISQQDEDAYFSFFHPRVLRYDKKTETQYEAINFGASKGLTFDRILVKPNNKLLGFLLNVQQLESPYKYYVVVTRPRYSLTFVVDELPNSIQKFSKCSIQLRDQTIEGFKYVP